MSHAHAIEEFFRRRYGRDALYVPTGRAALYLAFREWLRPGDRVLMSPITDDVVFFVVLAAGLVPVLGPIDPSTGNLDPTAVADSTWPTLHAVLTTNLYGIPDRMDLLEERCRQHDLVLLEDGAHALDSHWGGRRIGQFGAAAAYSLHKHLDIVGGVLTFSDPARRGSLERRLHREIRERPLHQAIAQRLRAWLGDVAPPRAHRWLRAWRARLITRAPERSGHRMPYDVAEVRQRLAEGGGLDAFDRWVRVDNAMYRTWPLSYVRSAALQTLSEFAATRARRLEGAARLLESGLAGPIVSLPADTALFRVPLFVRDRERVRAHFAGHGMALDYIYDPPLDVYAPDLTERLPTTRRALHWSRDVLPVDPLSAERFLALVSESQRRGQPLVEPIEWSTQSFSSQGALKPIEAL